MVPRDYRDAAVTRGPDRMLDLFVERVEDYRATVQRCTHAELADRLAAETSGRRVVVPPGLPWAAAGRRGRRPRLTASAAELDPLDGVVTAAAVGHRRDRDHRARPPAPTRAGGP